MKHIIFSFGLAFIVRVLISYYQLWTFRIDSIHLILHGVSIIPITLKGLLTFPSGFYLIFGFYMWAITISQRMKDSAPTFLIRICLSIVTAILDLTFKCIALTSATRIIYFLLYIFYASFVTFRLQGISSHPQFNNDRFGKERPHKLTCLELNQL